MKHFLTEDEVKGMAEMFRVVSDLEGNLLAVTGEGKVLAEVEVESFTEEAYAAGAVSLVRKANRIIGYCD